MRIFVKELFDLNDKLQYISANFIIIRGCR